jgi:hypothetical protein
VPTSEVGTPLLVGTLIKASMETSTEEIQGRRLDRLEQQAALFGPNTEPAILIEIAELRNKVRPTRGDQRGSFVNALDFDLVRSCVGAALIRIGVIESNQSSDKKSRWVRQLIHDLWMVAITTMVFLILWMQIVAK